MHGDRDCADGDVGTVPEHYSPELRPQGLVEQRTLERRLLCPVSGSENLADNGLYKGAKRSKCRVQCARAAG